jgi:dihydrodipicolinate synthase/N-acetylneuraminate lyase
MSQSLSGIFPPIASPFNTDGDLMIDWFHENVEKLAETPLAGFVVAGSNGESASLSDDEKLLMLKGARARIGEPTWRSSGRPVTSRRRWMTTLCLRTSG